jgi:5-methylcytosine-specific restriction endonuclease McrA
MGQLDAHEKWSYDDEKHIQKLEDILSLCKDCHRVKHIGRAQAVGEGDLAENWYMKVNSCSRHEFQEDLNNAANQWRERSMYRWALDISLIDGWEDKIG